MDINKSALPDAVTRMKAGDEGAFEKVYNITYRQSYFTAFEITQSEQYSQFILQNAYISTLAKINDLSSDSFLNRLNMSIANEAVKILKKNNQGLFESNNEEKSNDDLPDNVYEDTDKYTPGSYIDKNELQREVMKLIDSFDVETRTVTLLYYYCGISTSQISESLKISKNDINNIISTAGKELTKSFASIQVAVRALRSAASSSEKASVDSDTAVTLFNVITVGSGINAKLTKSDKEEKPKAEAENKESESSANPAKEAEKDTADLEKGTASKGKFLSRFSTVQKVIAIIAVTALVACSIIGIKLISIKSGSCGKNLTYTIDKGNLIISGKGDMYDYDVYGRPWRYLENFITGIVIENGVTSIGTYAFIDCKNVTNVTIPGSITSIGRDAFNSCISLQSISIPGSVKTIGQGAFADSGLTGADIPDGIESIGYYTFDSSHITDIKIPDTVTNIEGYAFSGCDDLNDVYYSGSEREKAAIKLSDGNDELLNATWHYNYKD